MKMAYTIITFFLILMAMITFYTTAINQQVTNPLFTSNIPQSNNAVGLANNSPVQYNGNCIQPNSELISPQGVLLSLNTSQLDLGTCQPTNNGTSSTDILAFVLATVGIFVALGLLAGAFGVGSFANVITYVGIAISMEIGINVTIAAFFAGMPPLLWGIINGVFAIFWIILIMDGLANRPSAEAE